jgi:acetyl-CoA carboxylase carboxyl transferase subunit alpha
MLQHSIYSVASPEGCAAILWGDSAKAEEAAAHLKLTAEDLLSFGIVDEILSEPLGGAHREPVAFVSRVLVAAARDLDRLSSKCPDELRDGRYKKYRRIGAWQTREAGAAVES